MLCSSPHHHAESSTELVITDFYASHFVLLNVVATAAELMPLNIASRDTEELHQLISGHMSVTVALIVAVVRLEFGYRCHNLNPVICGELIVYHTRTKMPRYWSHESRDFTDALLLRLRRPL